MKYHFLAIIAVLIAVIASSSFAADKPLTVHIETQDFTHRRAVDASISTDPATAPAMHQEGIYHQYRRACPEVTDLYFTGWQFVAATTRLPNGKILVDLKSVFTSQLNEPVAFEPIAGCTLDKPQLHVESFDQTYATKLGERATIYLPGAIVHVVVTE